MKINILGSCVTRDAFESTKHNFEIEHYFARTSIISIMSSPLKVNESDFKLSSNFQKKCVLNDVYKTFFNSMVQSSSDYIVIDLIDERFNLLKIGNSIITKSNELVASKFLETSNIYEEIPRNLESFVDSTSKVKQFFAKLIQIYETNKIILHKTFWRDSYKDISNNVKEFDKIPGIIKQNEHLNRFYDYLEREFPEIYIIDMSKQKYYASENHKWGLAPYHYEDKYYFDFMEKITEYTGEWSANYYTKTTKMGNVNLITNYDCNKTFLDSATASNISNTKNLNIDEKGIPLLKVGNNGQYGNQYYPITIGVYGLECVSKYYKTKEENYLKNFLTVCDYFVTSQRADGGWEANFDYFYGVKESGVCKGPWISALGQGFGISCLVRGYYLTKNEEFINSAILAANPFKRNIEEGGVKRILFNQFTYYEEYPTEKPTHILNSFIFSLLGLYDLFSLTRDNSIYELYKDGVNTLVKTVSSYDLGNVSSYDLTHFTISGNPAKYHYGYHLTHIKLLSAINLIEKNDTLSRVMERWISYANGNKSCFRLDEKKIKLKINNSNTPNIEANEENRLEISYDINEELEYAFYLYKDNEKIATKKYSKENIFNFIPTDGNYKVITFVKDNFGTAISKEYSLVNKKHADIHLDNIIKDIEKSAIFSLDNECLKVELFNNYPNILFAYYLNLNNKNIMKQWYSTSTEFQYNITEDGIYTLVVFCIDNQGLKRHFEKQISYTKNERDPQ